MIAFYGLWSLAELVIFERIDLLTENEILNRFIIDVVIKNLVWTLPAVVLIYRFKDDSPARAVISILKVIEQITTLEPGITVENIGNTDIIVEKVSFQKDRSSDRAFYR